MKEHSQKEKTHFQIERIAFFSDAVIAIAVTLLIIEIHAPKIVEGSSFNDQLGQLAHLFPEFVSFIISFAIILSQWTKHHELFGNIIKYDQKLISLNSIFLFSIAIIPFSTSYFAHNNTAKDFLPYIVYGCSLILTTMLNFLILQHAASEKNRLIDSSISKEHLKWMRADYLLLPTAILAGLLIGIFSFKAGMIAYIIVAQFGFYINKQKKKLKDLFS